MNGQNRAYPEDDDRQTVRALDDLAERCNDLERRVDILENNEEFVYDWEGNEEEVDKLANETETRDNDDEPIALLGDIDEDDETTQIVLERGGIG